MLFAVLFDACTVTSHARAVRLVRFDHDGGWREARLKYRADGRFPTVYDKTRPEVDVRPPFGGIGVVHCTMAASPALLFPACALASQKWWALGSKWAPFTLLGLTGPFSDRCLQVFARLALEEISDRKPGHRIRKSSDRSSGRLKST